MPPRISVVIQAYRRTRHLARAVDSVLLDRGSDPERTEIHVITDSLPSDLADALRNQGVTITLSPDRAIGRHLSLGIRKASGDVIAFLDDDDRFLPGKIKALERVFSSPDVVLFRHPVVAVDGDVGHDNSPPNTLSRITVPASMPAESFDLPLSQADLVSLRRRRALNNLSSMAVRRASLVDRLGALDLIDVSPDLLIPCLLTGPGRMVVDWQTPLSEWRIHPSLSNGVLGTDQPAQQYAEYIARSVRCTYALAQRLDGVEARAFLENHARAWDVTRWALTGDWVLRDRSPVNHVVRAIAGKLEERSYTSAGKVSATALLGRYSRQLAARVVCEMRRRELRAALAR